MASTLAQKTIVLCVTGSIAAYKAVLVARLLVKNGAKVVPLMTPSATRFVGPPTLAGICGETVRTDMFDPAWPGEMHVDLAARADAVLVVPATADVLARMAHGRADDLVTALVLCAKSPVVVAPAMHPRMWHHPATAGNVDALGRQGRVTLVGPVHGEVASGEAGLGRMAEPEAIVGALDVALRAASEPGRTQANGAVAARVDLAGVRIVVTAGPTMEDLDPVRYLGNRSSGKMGFAIAERAARRGADVRLVAGPVSLQTPEGVSRIDVRTALDMQRALAAELGKNLRGADSLVMAAAVADFRPSTPSTTKIKRNGKGLTLDLVANPDLVAEIGAQRTGETPYLVGFALETAEGDALVQLARKKLRAKRIDLVVANAASDSLGREDNRATLVGPREVEALDAMPKADLADAILDKIGRAVRRAREPGLTARSRHRSRGRDPDAFASYAKPR